MREAAAEARLPLRGLGCQGVRAISGSWARVGVGGQRPTSAGVCGGSPWSLQENEHRSQFCTWLCAVGSEPRRPLSGAGEQPSSCSLCARPGASWRPPPDGFPFSGGSSQLRACLLPSPVPQAGHPSHVTQLQRCFIFLVQGLQRAVTSSRPTITSDTVVGYKVWWSGPWSPGTPLPWGSPHPPGSALLRPRLLLMPRLQPPVELMTEAGKQSQ